MRRLSVYRQSGPTPRQPVDSTKARVHLVDGEVVYGQLWVEAGGAFIVDPEGIRHEIELKALDCLHSRFLALRLFFSGSLLF